MTDKILIDRELLERTQAVLSRWSGIINYQYTGSREAMTYLQTADDVSQPVLNEISAALSAPQQEAVAWVRYSAGALPHFVPVINGSATFDCSAIEALEYEPLYLHPAPRVPEGWQLVEECRSSVKFDLNRYERMALDFKRLGAEGKQTYELSEAEAARLQALLEKIDAMLSAAPKAPSEDDRITIPKEPPPGLLMSMAIRFDHGLGVPGYYDMIPLYEGCTHAMHLESTLRQMRQLYEEVSGQGFYKPERESKYAAIAAQKGEDHVRE